jgi:hypothetical protein
VRSARIAYAFGDFVTITACGSGADDSLAAQTAIAKPFNHLSRVVRFNRRADARSDRAICVQLGSALRRFPEFEFFQQMHSWFCSFLR